MSCFLMPADLLRSLNRWLGLGKKLEPVGRGYCPYCDELVVIRVVAKVETFQVKDVRIHRIPVNVATCTKCGEEIFDEVLDDENLKRAYRKYNETASEKDLIFIPED